MTDRAGFVFADLVKFQDEQLALWSERVHANVMADVSWYVKQTNREAKSPEEKHVVHRGQTIIELIRTWPVINPVVYPAPHKYPSQQDAVETLI